MTVVLSNRGPYRYDEDPDGAFVARPGKALFPLFPQPDIVGKDLREVSEAILATEPRP